MSAMLTELIAKLEAATEGGSRELDAEIMFDLHAVPVGKKEDGGPSGYLWPEDNPSWSFGLRFPGKSREWFFQDRSDTQEKLIIKRDGALVLMNSLRIPHLTTSIDAALTLVPAPALWTIAAPLPAAPWPARVCVYIPDKYNWPEKRYAHGKTPALVICIAAIKARAAGAP